MEKRTVEPFAPGIKVPDIEIYFIMWCFTLQQDVPSHASRYCGCLTPAEKARVATGLTPDKAAKAARICPAYLKRIERKGNAPYCLAVRLASCTPVPCTCFCRQAHDIAGNRAFNIAQIFLGDDQNAQHHRPDSDRKPIRSASENCRSSNVSCCLV